MDGPEDKKRTIADIISHISWFTNRIKWIMSKDLKPRILIGMKSDGTPVDIHTEDGLPMFSNQSEGEVLIENALIPIEGTTVAYSEWFHPKGYRYLFITLKNPVWVTNPTGLTIKIEWTPDETDKYLLMDSTNSAIAQAIGYADSTTLCYFLSYSAQNNRLPYPCPRSTDKIRLKFTPTGTAESKSITLNVFGVG